MPSLSSYVYADNIHVNGMTPSSVHMLDVFKFCVV